MEISLASGSRNAVLHVMSILVVVDAATQASTLLEMSATRRTHTARPVCFRNDTLLKISPTRLPEISASRMAH